MIALASPFRVFLYRMPTDMCKNFHGLLALTESALSQDPLSGSLFVFVNRRRDRMTILYWGETGFCIWYQQLQKGTYLAQGTCAFRVCLHNSCIVLWST